MRYIVYSDAQYYNNPSKSFITDRGISSWLQTQLDITKSILNFAIEKDIDLVIHNGDLFEEKSRINVQLYNRVWDLYNEYSKKLHIVFNTGNHDLHSITGESSLQPFSDRIWIIGKPTEIEANMWMYPYGYRDFPTVSKKDITLLIHDEIDFFCGYDSGNSIPLTNLTDYKLVFSGHIHNQGQCQNVYSIGSIMINDFGEDRLGRRFLYVKDDEVESIPISCPGFYDLESLDDIDKINDKDFFRIAVSKSQMGHEIFKSYNIFPLVSKTEERKIRISSNLNEEDRVKIYIEEKNDGLDPDLLLKVGRGLTND
jgi:predicted phosphodiesterase